MLAFGLWLAAVNECCFVRADVLGREVGADVAVEVSLMSLKFEKVLLTADVVDGKALFVFGEAEMSWNLVRVASTVANASRTSSQRKDAGEWLSVLALLELCDGVSELMGGGVAFGVSGMVSLSGDLLLVVTRVVVREDRLGGFVSVHNGLEAHLDTEKVTDMGHRRCSRFGHLQGNGLFIARHKQSTRGPW